MLVVLPLFSPHAKHKIAKAWQTLGRQSCKNAFAGQDTVHFFCIGHDSGLNDSQCLFGCIRCFKMALGTHAQLTCTVRLQTIVRDRHPGCSRGGKKNLGPCWSMAVPLVIQPSSTLSRHRGKMFGHIANCCSIDLAKHRPALQPVRKT